MGNLLPGIKKIIEFFNLYVTILSTLSFFINFVMNRYDNQSQSFNRLDLFKIYTKERRQEK